MLFRWAVLVALVAYGLRSYLLSRASFCYCQPHEPCWPSPSSWQMLNDSLGGNLMALRPAGAACVGNLSSSLACHEVTTNFHNTTWRVLNPAALQVVNWEHSRPKKQSCHITSEAISNQCHQGRVARYSVYVQSVAQVQAAVRFATTHRLRLTIRNTGHDLAGRSTSPDSLQVHTAGLKGIEYTASFQPFVPGDASVASQGPAVTVGAGVMTGELYTTAARDGYTVVGGSCSTVGIAGGWMQGGGYGILSPSLGLGVDNVMEFGLVTADGKHIIANSYHNQDLFWAVRGGGGGSFGVVVSVTFRTHPDLSATVAKLNVMSPKGADDVFWEAVQEHLTIFPDLIDQGSSLQTFVIPELPGGGALLSIEVYLINPANGTGSAIIQRHRDRLERLGLLVDFSETHFDRISTYLAVAKGMDQAGVGIMTASRLVSRRLVDSPHGPGKIVNVLSRLGYKPGDIISLEGIAGNRVASPEARESSSVHPDWRSALLSLTLARALPVEPDWLVYEQVQQELAHTQLPLIESLEDGQRGGYLGIPFPYEVNPARTFWGSNYERLLQVKRHWDPEDLFITRLGVGSEDWDDEGVCRSSRNGGIFLGRVMEDLQSLLMG